MKYKKDRWNANRMILLAVALIIAGFSISYKDYGDIRTIGSLLLLIIASVIFYRAGRKGFEDEIRREKLHEHWEELTAMIRRIMRNTEEYAPLKFNSPDEEKILGDKLARRLKENANYIVKQGEGERDYKTAVLYDSLMRHLESKFPNINSAGWDKTVETYTFQMITLFEDLGWEPYGNTERIFHPRFPGRCSVCEDWIGVSRS